METLNIIKESFEKWYNQNVATSREEIVINYSDTQNFAIKAIHTINLEMCAIGINNGMSYTKLLLKIQENYNHCEMGEETAKEEMMKKMLEEMYGWKRDEK